MFAIRGSQGACDPGSYSCCLHFDDFGPDSRKVSARRSRTVLASFFEGVSGKEHCYCTAA